MCARRGRRSDTNVRCLLPSEPDSLFLQLCSFRRCVLGYTTLLRKIRVVRSLRCCLQLLGDLFMIDSLKLDELLSVLC